MSLLREIVERDCKRIKDAQHECEEEIASLRRRLKNEEEAHRKNTEDLAELEAWLRQHELVNK